ncbi:hypothetical protein OSB04_002466 [Centaurea solstitialis]|uniref:Uncharacterized protein n=1 Tax=Centaurea solstitialis TaxID=347529 RepID=A0AA38U4S0_9ASTR|nr:hypothetical protein OSB04_002466 [Centaurea solstitialis]
MEVKGQKKGEYLVPTVCFIIILLDLIAGILGIQAEEAQNKVQSLKVWVIECRDPSNKAFKLGFAAAVLLAFAHAVANVLGGCHCAWFKEELERVSYNMRLAVASLILSWYPSSLPLLYNAMLAKLANKIALVIGFSMLIAGVMVNSSSRKSCGISHHRYLSIGGIACIIHAMFAVCYYISATVVEKEEKKLNPPGMQVHQQTPQEPA